jgi:hypothetical protein
MVASSAGLTFFCQASTPASFVSTSWALASSVVGLVLQFLPFLVEMVDLLLRDLDRLPGPYSGLGNAMLYHILPNLRQPAERCPQHCNQICSQQIAPFGQLRPLLPLSVAREGDGNRISYDNTRIAITKILTHHKRKHTAEFKRLSGVFFYFCISTMNECR